MPFLRLLGIFVAVALRQRTTPALKFLAGVLPAEESAIKNDASGAEAALHRTLREFLFGHDPALRAKVRIDSRRLYAGVRGELDYGFTTPIPRSSGIGGS